MPSLDDAIDLVGRKMDTLAEHHDRMGVAALSDDDAGVPPSMQDGPVDEDGWVSWKLMPSSARLEDVNSIETSTGLDFPVFLKAYLLARCHLFDQLHAHAHDDQLVFSLPAPTHAPLASFRKFLEAWAKLLPAGYLPVGEWGDSWGPIVVDVGEARASSPDEAPVVWFDHELLTPLVGQEPLRRDVLEPLRQPLYPNFESFLLDILEWHEPA